MFILYSPLSPFFPSLLSLSSSSSSSIPCPTPSSLPLAKALGLVVATPQDTLKSMRKQIEQLADELDEDGLSRKWRFLDGKCIDNRMISNETDYRMISYMNLWTYDMQFIKYGCLSPMSN